MQVGLVVFVVASWNVGNRVEDDKEDYTERQAGADGDKKWNAHRGRFPWLVGVRDNRRVWMAVLCP